MSRRPFVRGLIMVAVVAAAALLGIGRTASADSLPGGYEYTSGYSASDPGPVGLADLTTSYLQGELQSDGSCIDTISGTVYWTATGGQESDEVGIDWSTCQAVLDQGVLPPGSLPSAISGGTSGTVLDESAAVGSQTSFGATDTGPQHAQDGAMHHTAGYGVAWITDPANIPVTLQAPWMNYDTNYKSTISGINTGVRREQQSDGWGLQSHYVGAFSDHSTTVKVHAKATFTNPSFCHGDKTTNDYDDTVWGFVSSNYSATFSEHIHGGCNNLLTKHAALEDGNPPSKFF